MKLSSILTIASVANGAFAFMGPVAPRPSMHLQSTEAAIEENPRKIGLALN